jgi:hypothetical protein
MTVEGLDLTPRKLTRWQNRTHHTMRFELHVAEPTPISFNAEGEAKMGPRKTIKVVLAPNEEVEIPSEYDEGIQQTRIVDGTRMVVGGHAPALTRLEVQPRYHPSMVPATKELPIPGIDPAEFVECMNAAETSDDEPPDPVQTAKKARRTK